MKRLILPLLLACLTAPVAAQQRSIALERFHADIRVQEDGYTEVAETLDIRFDGSWNGVFREVSLRHETAQGRRQRLRLEVQEVTDGQGRPLQYESNREGMTQSLQIWVPGAVDATRRVVVRYRVPNALRFFDDATHREGGHDELYWNVTGNDWEMPIHSASARITLPAAVRDVEAWAYTGPAGSDESAARVQVAGNVVSVQATRAFAAFEGLTVSAAWAPGAVDRAAAAAAARGGFLERLLATPWPMLLPGLALFFGFRSWKRHGREPRRRSISVAYEPPPGLSPAEVGTLVDHQAEMHDLTSTVVDLAVRGYVVIEEVETKRFFGLSTSTDYVFHMRRAPESWDTLAPHEKQYLLGIFARQAGVPYDVGRAGQAFVQALTSAREKGKRFDPQAFQQQLMTEQLTDPGAYRESVKLSELQNRFYKHLTGIRNAVYDRLVEQGYYRRRPDQAGTINFIFVVALFVAGVFTLIMAGNGEILLDWRWAAAGFGSAILILAVFGSRMKARTEAGVRALEQALGFREFLSRVESDRYRRMITSPEMFERFLPHAMAFRVEKRWARAFEHLYTTPPNWYRSNSGAPFRASAFASGMHRMSSQAGRTMSSSPSGSGGGGSSGGGSGGGGGRGF
jgi:uncharacterized membrane protein YgcG